MQATWSLIQQGGVTMAPLLLCSVLALAVVVDRAWALRRSRILAPPLVAEVAAWRAAPPGAPLPDLARHRAPLAEVLAPLALALPEERDLAVERVQAAGRRTARRLERGLLVLEIVAGISPLLGLFGTVLGMFETFRVIATSGLGDPGALSGGISEALVTTIFGLGIGIPALVAHSWFGRRVDDLVAEMEEIAAGLLDWLYPHGTLRPDAAGGAGAVVAEGT